MDLSTILEKTIFIHQAPRTHAGAHTETREGIGGSPESHVLARAAGWGFFGDGLAIGLLVSFPAPSCVTVCEWSLTPEKSLRLPHFPIEEEPERLGIGD